MTQFTLELSRVQQMKLLDLVVEFVREERDAKFLDHSLTAADAVLWRHLLHEITETNAINVRIGKALLSAAETSGDVLRR